MGVNYYFDPRRRNIPHATPNYAPGKCKFELIITDRHIVLQTNWLVYE